MNSVLVIIANGSEELEAITVINLLRRAGIPVVVASISNLQIKGARGINIVADKLLKDCFSKTWKMVVLPGGMPGAENLSNSDILKKMLGHRFEKNELVAAICASPAVILNKFGLLDGMNATCHEDFYHQLSKEVYVDESVVNSENLITANGPGSAIKFSLEIIKTIRGKKESEKIERIMS